MKKLAALSALPFLLMGCEGDEGQDYVAAVEIAQCGVTEVEINTNDIIITEADETVQWSAVANAPAGQSGDCDFAIGWSSDDESVATVSSSGVISTVSAGTANITATVARFSATAEFTVSDATLDSIELDPATVSIDECTSATITATGNYSDGSSRDITGLSKLTWSTDDSALATVASSTTDNITLASHNSGAGTLSASHSAGISGTADLSILDTLTSITLSPLSLAIYVGDSSAIIATGNYNDGSNIDISQNSDWSLAETAQASVVSLSNSYGSKGSIAALSTGSAVASAECGGLSAEADTAIVVSEVPTLSSISFSTTADPLYLTTDDTDEELILNATYSDGSIVDVTESADWDVITGDDDYIEVDDDSGNKGELILSSDIAEITEEKSVIIHATFDDSTAQIEVIVVPD